MILLHIELSTRKNKRFVATFKDGTKLIKTHFGYKYDDGRFGSTYIDHKDPIKKANYIARHGVNENWTDPTTPATLSRYILWGESTLKQALSAFRHRFQV